MRRTQTGAGRGIHTTLRIPEDLRAKLETEAKANGVVLGEEIRRRLQTSLNEFPVKSPSFLGLLDALRQTMMLAETKGLSYREFEASARILLEAWRPEGEREPSAGLQEGATLAAVASMWDEDQSYTHKVMAITRRLRGEANE